MRKFGLIGKSLEHSFSPDYFASKFSHENILDAEYKAYGFLSPDF
jgi:shikimate dehydrogenase